MCPNCKGTGYCRICDEGITEEGNECPMCEGTGDCLTCEKNLPSRQIVSVSDDSMADKSNSVKEAEMKEEFVGRTEGVDVNGVSRKLGDRDSMGHIVGFIDEDYNCWETVAERDGSLTAGRYTDAMHEWERDKSKPCPSPLDIATKTCLDPDNVPQAVQEAREAWEFILAIRPAARQKMVEEIVERFRALDNPSIHDLRDELNKFLPRKLREE